MKSAAMSRPLGPSRETLPVQLAHVLRTKLRDGVWDHGAKLPTEADLCAEFGMSRVTVRQAVKILENQGLVETRQGIGTIATTATAMVHAGLQELKSITESIREMGLDPSMEYRWKTIREADASERKDFGLTEGSQVLSLRRIIRADGIVVAYCDDSLPLWALDAGFTPNRLEGSVFAYLAENTDMRPRKAVAEVHARRGLPESWAGDRSVEDVEDDDLYILLDQIHYDERSRPFMRTRAHFVEGRFSFVVLRLA